MADTKPFFAAVESRRTIYPLKNESPISDERIKEIVTAAVKHAPSAFNSQTGRVVLVLKQEHVKLWEAIMEVYKAMLPEERYKGAKERFDMFKAAYGTVSLIISSLSPLSRSPSLTTCFRSRYSSTKILPMCVNSKKNSRTTKTNSHNVSHPPFYPEPRFCPSLTSPANTSSSLSYRVRAEQRHDAIHHLDRS